MTGIIMVHIVTGSIIVIVMVTTAVVHDDIAAVMVAVNSIIHMHMMVVHVRVG